MILLHTSFTERKRERDLTVNIIECELKKLLAGGDGQCVVDTVTSWPLLSTNVYHKAESLLSFCKQTASLI